MKREPVVDAVGVYRCRLCKQEFRYTLRRGESIEVAFAIAQERQRVLMLHDCDDGRHGVAELQAMEGEP